METIEEFKKQQEQTVKVLEQLFEFLQEGERYGVEADQAFKQKLEVGIKATADDKLKVALIGGFSEGKTSIAAAWTEKYDKTTMKIDTQESSDEVTVYKTENFDLYDTPGLFGYKEKKKNDNDREKYKDITRKYVSEAHLVLYVMDPVNPIKESHKEELIWLFKELNLLPRTIFVLSHFDDAVDIEDDKDYEAGLKIKQDNIIGRLKDFELISDDGITVVAVAANPFEKGIEYWLSHLDNFKKLSHIESLQKATTEKIKSLGANSSLIEESKKSIIIDVLKNKLPIAIDREEKAKIEYDKFCQVYDDIKKELERTYSSLNRTRIELREFISNHFTENLILRAKGLSMDTIVDFFEREIGSEGIVLSTKISNEYERQLGSSFHAISKMQTSLNAGVQQYNNVIGKAIGDYAKKSLKTGSNFLKSGAVSVTGESVKHLRNVFMATHKFKPWGAIKLAGKINKALPLIGQAIGIGLDVWDLIDQKKKEAEFQKGIDNMVSNFEGQRKEQLDFLNDEDKFISECFPNYIDLKKQLEELHTDLQNKQKQSEDFQRWREKGEAIKAEFEIIS